MLTLILLAAIVGVGLVLWLEHRHHLRREAARQPSDTGDGAQPDEKPEAEEPQEECCGMHMTCERDSLLAAVSEKIEYYDDEELDRFAGREPDVYTDSEIEEFRDIMLTMRPDEIAGWVRSLQLRNIQLPQPVRDEIIMIVAEARSAVPHNA